VKIQEFGRMKTQEHPKIQYVLSAGPYEQCIAFSKINSSEGGKAAASACPTLSRCVALCGRFYWSASAAHCAPPFKEEHDDHNILLSCVTTFFSESSIVLVLFIKFCSPFRVVLHERRISTGRGSGSSSRPL
jgi:hypothetical protein